MYKFLLRHISQDIFHFSSTIYPVELLAHKVTLSLIMWETARLFAKVAMPLYFPTSIIWGFWFLCILPSTCCSPNFFIIAILVSVERYLIVVLICIFLLMFMAICISSLRKKMSIRIILIGFLFYFIFKSSFYILYANPLSNVLQLLPPILWVLFTILMVSLEAQSFLILMKSSLSLGFPDSSAGKESACNAGDHGSIPGSGSSPGEGKGYPLQYYWASLVAQLGKNPPAMWETWVRSLGWEDPLEKGKTTHSSILAWRILWTVSLSKNPLPNLKL